MAEQVEAIAIPEKVNVALQETRILVLGTEILLGFQHTSFFQPGFAELAPASQRLLLLAHALLIVVIGLLLVPPAYHRIACGGSDERIVSSHANRVAELALLPLGPVIGTDAYVVVGHAISPQAGAAFGAVIATFALLAWYALGWLRRKPTEWMERMDKDRPRAEPTSLNTKIQRMLLETRVVLPGVQALLGFQFSVFLTEAFERLPDASKYIHVGALFCIAVAVVLLMAPAAYHRIVTRGDATEGVLAFGTAVLLAAMPALALGLSLDLYIVVKKVIGSASYALAASGAAMALMIALWFGWPMLRRMTGGPDRIGEAS